jgi:hypothetical protein
MDIINNHNNCINFYNCNKKFCIICANNVYQQNIDINKLKQMCENYGIIYEKLNKKSKFALEIMFKFYNLNIISLINKKDISDKIYDDLYHKIEIYLKNKYGTELEIYLLHMFITNRINNIINNIIFFLNKKNYIMLKSIKEMENKIKTNKKFCKQHNGHVNYAISLIKARAKQLCKENTCYNLIIKDYSMLLKLNKFDFSKIKFDY